MMVLCFVAGYGYGLVLYLKHSKESIEKESDDSIKKLSFSIAPVLNGLSNTAKKAKPSMTFAIPIEQ
jgi:hypothetical protein